MMLDYPFREDQIATSPSVPRDNCRLLVVHRREGRWEHRRFHQLASLLRAGDCLVLNTTRVLPARLLGRRASGRGLDLLVLRKLSAMQWEVLGRRLRIGETLCFSEGLKARVLGRGGERSWAVEFSQEEIPQYLQRHGQAPLPPYILKRRNACAQDLRDYQTVYAQVPGSIAAPTAGLHFTEELLEGLRRRGVEIAGVLLHLGWGSFQPLSEQALESGRLSAEYFEVSPEDARRIRETRRAGGRVVAVGTSAVRALEASAAAGGEFSSRCGWTDILIGPRHSFLWVDGLITNFHFPRSSPLLLTASFAGRELLLRAYQEASESGYRFYSYGDSMLIL